MGLSEDLLYHPYRLQELESVTLRDLGNFATVCFVTDPCLKHNPK